MNQLSKNIKIMEYKNASNVISCLGVKVNGKLVPLSYVLSSGDQVEIITSKKQSPRKDWLRFIVTSQARSKIKSALKKEEKIIA